MYHPAPCSELHALKKSMPYHVILLVLWKVYVTSASLESWEGTGSGSYGKSADNGGVMQGLASSRFWIHVDEPDLSSNHRGADGVVYTSHLPTCPFDNKSPDQLSLVSCMSRVRPRTNGQCGTRFPRDVTQTHGVRPVHLLRVSLLRVLESTFPGDPLSNSTDMRIPTPEN